MKKYIRYSFSILMICIARLIPLSWIIGSHCTTFSLSTIFAPIIGYHVGLAWVFLFLIPLKSLTVASLGWHVVQRLPLLCSSYVYQKQHPLSWIGIPLLCLILFLLHPTGAQAWGYPIYWFIPMMLYFVPQTIWSRALACVLVAHAVGSVIWLYGASIPVQIWWTLIPIVACERLFMMLGIVLSEQIFAFCRNHLGRCAVNFGVVIQ